MQALDKYVRSATDAIWAVSNGQDPRRELELLGSVESELRNEIAALHRRPDPNKAAQQHAHNASQQRDRQVFLITFNGGGHEHVTGWAQLAKRLTLRESSIRVMLSKGQGQFSIRRHNPVIAQWDIAVVARLTPTGEPALGKAKIGRPRTRPLTEEEYLAQSLHTSKDRAKSVQKDRNRRTARKP